MDWHEERMLVIAAKMYYEDSLTQSEIADRLGIYRTTITRMLQKARDEGIVRIEIKGSERVRVDIEQKINKRFGLKDSVLLFLLKKTLVEPPNWKRSEKQLILYWIPLLRTEIQSV
ncbi:helix-turn-helix domain-containing protein [Sinobaca sp. H24]|uniref:helix-turn-helix domain-containing protein n=1 Tax=Sinobaca sp. H24 TaxID=2923376 RepID=UPI00207A0002|nr:helix-turn-helix domain-containing protein [Sinobaca sp. H24]